MPKKPPRNNDTLALKDAFMHLLRNKRNEAGYFRARTKMVWRKFFGNYVDDGTRDLMVRNGKLYVYANNAALRNQLLIHREGIRERLNKEFGEEYFTEVVIK